MPRRKRIPEEILKGNAQKHLSERIEHQDMDDIQDLFQNLLLRLP